MDSHAVGGARARQPLQRRAPPRTGARPAADVCALERPVAQDAKVVGGELQRFRRVHGRVKCRAKNASNGFGVVRLPHAVAVLARARLALHALVAALQRGAARPLNVLVAARRVALARRHARLGVLAQRVLQRRVVGLQPRERVVEQLRVHVAKQNVVRRALREPKRRRLPVRQKRNEASQSRVRQRRQQQYIHRCYGRVLQRARGVVAARRRYAGRVGGCCARQRIRQRSANCSRARPPSPARARTPGGTAGTRGTLFPRCRTPTSSCAWC
jgi:hypothetical protein